MENLIGVGNNRKIPFNPMILKKTEVTLSEPLHGFTDPRPTWSWQYIQFIHVWTIITLYIQQAIDDHLRLDNMHFHRHSFQRKNYFELLHRYRDKVCVQKLFGHAISLFITIRSKFTKWKQTLIACKTCWRT